MKTDSLFYKLFQQAPQLVLELAGLEQADEKKYRFRSEEIKQTAFRLDGVLTPPSDNAKSPLVFVEVQFQVDHAFYSRFFCSPSTNRLASRCAARENATLYRTVSRAVKLEEGQCRNVKPDRSQ